MFLMITRKDFLRALKVTKADLLELLVKIPDDAELFLWDTAKEKNVPIAAVYQTKLVWDSRSGWVEHKSGEPAIILS